MVLGDVETVGVVCEGEAGLVWEKKLEIRAVFVWVVGWKVEDEKKMGGYGNVAGEKDQKLGGWRLPPREGRQN
jgi:hypothetical protein